MCKVSASLTNMVLALPEHMSSPLVFFLVGFVLLDLSLSKQCFVDHFYCFVFVLLPIVLSVRYLFTEGYPFGKFKSVYTEPYRRDGHLIRPAQPVDTILEELFHTAVKLGKTPIAWGCSSLKRVLNITSQRFYQLKLGIRECNISK